MSPTRRKFIQMATITAAGLSVGAAPTVRTDMPYRRLGRTGESVSLLGLGGAHMGQGDSPDQTQAIAIMRAAVDAGINFFDNAWSYTEGRCEERMGLALADGYRDKVFLMSKVLSRDLQGARQQLEDSLRRLRTDTIDLWQFHSIQNNDDIEMIYNGGLIELALRAQEEGKIRYIGFTGHTHPRLHVEMIRRGFAWDTVQMPLNVFDPHYLSFAADVLPLALEHDIGVIAMKTMAGTPGVIPGTGLVQPTECLRYAMGLPVSTVSSGMDTMERLQANIAVARNFTPLGKKELAALLQRTATAGAEGRHENYKSSG
jgi:uncharacterized protein